MADPPIPVADLLRCLRLKQVPRRGWELRQIQHPESVADHSWGTALLCLLFAEEEGVDPGAAAQLAVMHDLTEVITGDIVVHSPQHQEMTPAQKHLHECQALADLCRDAPLSRAARHWHAFEDQETPVARFVRDMDLVEMCLQALIYQSDQKLRPVEFFTSAEARIQTATGRRLLKRILAFDPNTASR